MCYDIDFGINGARQVYLMMTLLKFFFICSKRRRVEVAGTQVHMLFS